MKRSWCYILTVILLASLVSATMAPVHFVGSADGSNIQRLAYSALGDFASAGYSLADLNFDGQVNLADYGILASYVNGPVQPGQGWDWQRADFNQDGHIDLKDFLIFQKEFGRTNLVPLTSEMFGMHGQPSGRYSYPAVRPWHPNYGVISA